MKILITGGNGFLGSNLVYNFLKLEYQLLVISRSNNNIEEYLSNLQFIKYESEDYSNYEKQILDFNPNVIIHLAWDGGNNYKNINDINQINKNIHPGLSLLEIISKQNNNPKFIGFGSFLEYGKLEERANEKMIENPNNFYGLSKMVFKNISKMYCQHKNIEWIWIRPCYIYGNKDADNRLIPSVINNKLKNKEVVLDSCNTTIDYLHADDFCSAIIKIINKNVTGIFNICSGNEYNLKYILDFIDNNIESDFKIIYKKELDRILAPKYMCGSNDRLKDKIDWSPKIKIEDGILRTIDYYKSMML